MKRLREIAAGKNAEMTIREGGNHSVVRFDRGNVTTVPRHREVNEYTARSAIRAAESWTKGG